MENYRAEYASYYKQHALKDSPAMRHANPTVVLVPGVGMFSFGKNKAEARITGEFYVNAIHVMEGAGHLDEGKCPPISCRSRGLRRIPAPSKSTPTTLRCRLQKRFASSTGPWKKRRYAGSLPPRN